MGDNAAGEAFESIVVNLYERGLLDKDVLIDVIQSFREIDSGGYQGLEAVDGSDIHTIIIKTFNPEYELPEYTYEMFLNDVERALKSSSPVPDFNECQNDFWDYRIAEEYDRLLEENGVRNIF